MYYAFSIRCLFLVAFSVFMISGGGNALAAGEIECSTLLANAAKTGKKPSVYYAKDWGIIHIQTSSEKCIEPIEVWKARRLPWKVIKLAKGASPPAIGSAENRLNSMKKDIQLPKAEQVFSPPPISGGPLYSSDCNRRLNEFWFQGGHLIDGQFYWLSDVYTIDHDGNGIVDNIGFRLKSQGVSDIDIRYFAPNGNIQGSEIDKLKLASDKVIPWICFGRISFAEPPAVEHPNEMLNRPDLARDMMAKSGAVTDKAKEKNKNKNEIKAKKSQPRGALFWLLTGSLILVIGGGGAFWFVRLRRGSDDEYESDDEADV